MNRLPKRVVQALSLLLALGCPIDQAPAAPGKGRADHAGSRAAAPAHEAAGKPAAARPEPSSPSLAEAAQAFKSEPTDAGFGDLFKAVRTLLVHAGGGDPQAVIKANPALADLGVKVVPAGSARIWTFPRFSQCQAVFVQWTETRTRLIPGGRRRRRKLVAVSGPGVEARSLPSGVVLKDARMLDLSEGEKSARARYLIAVGSKRGAGGMWLASYRLGTDGWRADEAPLADIPPYLTSNMSGVIGFSGQDLLVTVTPGAPLSGRETAADQKLPEPASSTYKLVLRLVGGKFELEGRPAEDTPYNAVWQFVHACEQGCSDLARAWLVDPHLISIPKYIGLAAGNAGQPSRLINMSGAPAGLYRYRLVTFGRYDLILDAARVKNKWAIKAIFIAPADAFLQKVARGLSPAPAAEAPALPEGKEKDGATSR